MLRRQLEVLFALAASLLFVHAASSAQDRKPALDYDRLFQGARSEWVVAFGGDDHSAMSESAPPDVAQYRGFKTFLERLGFQQQARPAGVDNTGLAVFSRRIRAPDGHDHDLTVKVVSSSQHAGAGEEFIRTSPERRGYFALSHAGGGLGLRIGGSFLRPEEILRSPAPALVMGAIACKSFDHFACKIDKYMGQNKIDKTKLTYLGTTQEIDMRQSDGAFALLKETFSGVLGQRAVRSILKSANGAYNPIMPSYDRRNFERDPTHRMEMDEGIRRTPVLKSWAGGLTVELPRTLAARPSWVRAWPRTAVAKSNGSRSLERYVRSRPASPRPAGPR